jgi:4-amino-4-deoxy-L-arabinose transferase-like glycosyltransferase
VKSAQSRSQWWHSYVWWLVVSYFLIFAFTRWYHLTLLPIHFDEIVYLDRVSRIVSRHDFFIGLREDLRTGHLWVIALLWPLFPDRLWVGRFASTLAGVWGALGAYKSGTLLFSDRRVGLIAAIFYLIVPGLLFYDRMALADSLLTACGMWILYGVSVYFLKGDSRSGWWMSWVMALAILTKPNGFLFFAIPALGYVCLRQNPLSMKRIINSALPLVIGGVAAAALMAPFLRDTQGMLWGKAGVSSIAGWVDLGQRFGQNLIVSAGWLVSLLSLPVTFLAVVGLALALSSKRTGRQALYLGSAVLAQWLFFALVSEIWYPRYLLPVVPWMGLLAAYAVHKAIELSSGAIWRVTLVVTLAALMWPALSTDFWLFTHPSRAPLHPEESRQYITGWPSGYGLAEVAAFIRGLADQNPEIYVAYNDKGSVMAREGLEYYLPDPPPNIKFRSFDPFEGEAISRLNNMAASRPTFVVLNTAHEKGLDDFILNPDAFPQAQHVFRVNRPGGLTHWDVYQWVMLDELER